MGPWDDFAVAKRIRLSWYGASTLLVAVLVASCGTSPPGGGTSGLTTSTSTRPPTTTTTQPSATTTTQPLQSVAWDSVTVPPAVCPGLSQPVKLTSTPESTGPIGLATVPAPAGHQFGTPDVLIETSQEYYGDLEPGAPVAALSVWCSNTGGTADGQIQNSLVLYRWVAGQLAVLSTLTPPRLGSGGSHVAYFDGLTGGVTISSGAITAKELFYGPQDGTCCPSGRATTVWTFNGHTFSSGTSIQTEPVGT
jgi:hypothetical protein